MKNVKLSILPPHLPWQLLSKATQHLILISSGQWNWKTLGRLLRRKLNRLKMTKGQNETESSMKLKEMDEKNMHNLFLKNMAGLIEETKNPSPCSNP